MDFFESQDIARKKSRWLVAYFVLAVVLIIVGVYLAVVFVSRMTSVGLMQGTSGLWSPPLFLVVAVSSLLLMGGGTLFKIISLRSGGAAVAEMLGAQPVDPSTRDFRERRFINVVEEMSIASGMPVPGMYILDEDGINAFAAGYSPGDAAVAVTRGSLDRLTRDELQGVIAHEFSHILNGDMRLNIRLIGLLHGILLLAIVGRTFLYGSRGRIYTRRRGRGGGSQGMLLGLALLVIGSIGVFFGKLIKAAVSRQREFLADAAAVQFTRNPGGIAGALKKIGGLSAGSRIQDPHADELSHLFFANALSASFARLFSTHPPLDERIRRLDPSFDGRFPHIERAAPAEPKVAAAAAQLAPEHAAVRGERMAAAAPDLISSIGAPADKHVAYAASLLERIPSSLREAAHEPFNAEALTYAVLLDGRPAEQAKQLKFLEQSAGSTMSAQARSYSRLVQQAGPESRLPLIDLSLPALRQMSAKQYESFRRSVRELITADREITLFEFALERVLERHLDTSFAPQGPIRVRYHSMKPLRDDLVLVLSAIAHAGSSDRDEAQESFRAGLRQARMDESSRRILAEQACSPERLESALDRVEKAEPRVKKEFLGACAACVAYDGTVRVQEAELLRAISDAVDCPMPPVVAD